MCIHIVVGIGTIFKYLHSLDRKWTIFGSQHLLYNIVNNIINNIDTNIKYYYNIEINIFINKFI